MDSSSNSKPRILIVDDEPSLIESLELIFEEEGYEVSTMEDGQNIESRINEFHPDIMLIDVFLPYKNGNEIIKDLKANDEYKSIPMVLMSASENYAEKLDEIGADNFLSKPFSISDLLDKVNSLAN